MRVTCSSRLHWLRGRQDCHAVHQRRARRDARRRRARVAGRRHMCATVCRRRSATPRRAAIGAGHACVTAAAGATTPGAVGRLTVHVVHRRPQAPAFAQLRVVGGGGSACKQRVPSTRHPGLRAASGRQLGAAPMAAVLGRPAPRRRGSPTPRRHIAAPPRRGSSSSPHPPHHCCHPPPPPPWRAPRRPPPPCCLPACC